MQSLKASIQGLAKIRQAREQITQEKGWAVDHPQWLAEVTNFLPLVKNGKGMVPGSVGISTWKRFLAGKPVKPTNFKAFCQVLRLNWEEVADADTIIRSQGGTEEEISITQHSTGEEAQENSIPSPNFQLPNQSDWGEAMDVSVFYGRTEELSTLKQWIVQDNCRLVGLFGMGGIGKTALSVKFAQQVQHEFDYVIWRSLQNAPPINDILATLIQILSNQQETPVNLPESTSIRITRLIEYLRSSRCLLILDNAESILQAGAVAGQYRPGYEGYGEFIKRVGETFHRSCLLLTSCEKPQELAALEGETLPVRSLTLTGLHEEEARAIFQAKGTFRGTPHEWKEVIQHFGGNPLALNMVASCIRDAFSYSVSEFVKQLKVSSLPFTDITHLLDRQFNRLNHSEKAVMYWLAINRNPIFFSELKADILCPYLKQDLPDILKSLTRKSLIDKKNTLRCEKGISTSRYANAATLTKTTCMDSSQPIVNRSTGVYVSIFPDFQPMDNSQNQDALLFTLKPMVMDYVTNLFIIQICEEIETGYITLINSHSLLKSNTMDFVIKAQIRCIIQPIIDRLISKLRSKSNIENYLDKIFLNWRNSSSQTPNYITFNIINLQKQLNSTLNE